MAGRNRSPDVDALMNNEPNSRRQYEGGEFEMSVIDETAMNNTLKNPQQLRLLQQQLEEAKDEDNDSDEEGGPLEIDPDEENEMEESLLAKIKYRVIPNWRDKHWALTAFILGRLRANDYHILLSQLLGTGLLALAAWIVCRGTSSYLGITIFVPFVHYGLALQAHLRMLQSDAPMSCGEHMTFLLAYLV
jgi:hypothetical protein